MINQYPFTLMPLPYKQDALSPHLNPATVEVHYCKLHQAYVDKLNQTLSPYPAYHNWSLEKLIIHTRALPAEIRTPVARYAGGVYNHNLYWQNICPKGKPLHDGTFSKALNYYFGSFCAFQTLLIETALGTFGSGWAWLMCDNNGRLQVLSTPNQDTPLAQLNTPLLVVDIWEHSYFLQYQEKRKDYLENWWSLVNWPKVDAYYQYCRRTKERTRF